MPALLQSVKTYSKNFQLEGLAKGSQVRRAAGRSRASGAAGWERTVAPSTSATAAPSVERSVVAGAATVAAGSVGGDDAVQWAPARLVL